MAPNQSDLAFARLVIELKIASQDVVKQSLIELEKIKKQGDPNLNLGVMMYRKGLINDNDLSKIKQRHEDKQKQPKSVPNKPKQPQPIKSTPKVEQPKKDSLKHATSDALINKQFGSYIIRRLLGSGGMGKVYLGENPLLKKYAAIKVLSYNFAKDDHYLKRFYREAKMAAALQHPNIVQVYDFGHEHDLYYLVMEYVDGETLDDKIKREKKLSISESLRIHIDVLKALKIAHEQEIVHRDIKPENIMITSRGEIKVTDMGLARHQDPTQSEALTIEGQALGTPRFMAPEQALGEQIDSRTDLYALGISLYHSICGEFPYPGKKPVEILRNMLRSEPVQLKTHAPHVPGSINNIVMKFISKSKANRFNNADLAMKALERCQHTIANPEGLKVTKPMEVKPTPIPAPAPVNSPQVKTPSANRKAPLPPKTRAQVQPPLPPPTPKKSSTNYLLIILIILFALLLIAATVIIAILLGKDDSQANFQHESNNTSTLALLNVYNENFRE